MSCDLNRVHLIGRAGNAPDVGATASGARVATFRLATDRPVRRGDEQKTDWHTVVAWDRLATVVERGVRRGELVYVEGRIETRETSGRKGRRVVTEIVAEAVMPLGGRAEVWSPAEPDRPASGRPGVDADEDLPF
ncbi:MAG: single-stranded DNA-binding protein [Longimicrobiales bacterium]